MNDQLNSDLLLAPNPAGHAMVENWGYFDDNRREFVLTHPRPPRAWKNIVWNRTYNVQPAPFSGVAYRRDTDGAIVLMNWTGQRALYLIDEQTDEFVSLGALNGEGFSCRFGLNYQIIRREVLGVVVAIALVVPDNADAEQYRIVVHNPSNQPRKFRLVALFDTDISFRDPYFGASNIYRCAVDPAGKVLTVHNRSYLANRLHQACLAADRTWTDYDFDRGTLIGPYGTYDRPQNLPAWRGKSTDVPDALAIIGAVDLPVGANETAALHLAATLLKDAAEFPQFPASLANAAAFEFAWTANATYIRNRYDHVQVQTPDPDFNRFVNTWIKHQLAYCADWTRGWGKGFRDSMQDAWAFAALDPAQARRMIEEALPHQFADGRTVRKWGPVDSKPYNDGPAWLVYAVDSYIRESGDLEFLKTVHPFFQSEDRGTVLEHMMRGCRQLFEARGERGLCLMPFGDWNDQLTGPGKGGKGESVWTTMALVVALPMVAQLAGAIGENDVAKTCNQWRQTVVDALQKNAWNGQWFTRAIADDGTPVGHPDSAEGRIDILPQAFAILGDMATPDQIEKILSACDNLLLQPYGYLLNTPAYKTYDPRVGHTSGNPAGHVENGSNYVHASAFMLDALTRAGRIDKALDLFHRLLPTNPNNPPSHSTQEPFSLTNSYRGPEAGRTAGKSMFSWRTGAAGWIFRTALEGIVGVKVGLNELHLPTTLPKDWDSAQLTRRVRGKNITIQIRRTGAPQTTLDGHPAKSIPLSTLKEGSIIHHEV